MATLRKSKQRDFIKQLIIVAKEHTPVLREKGLDPGEKLQQLKEKYDEAVLAQTEQTDAKAAMKKATRNANEKLDSAYDAASEMVDLLTGFLGKDNALIKEIKRLRW